MKYVIFDLDATVIDSSHRQITKPDGSLDLRAWKKNSTYAKVMRDSLLPLANHWKTIQEKKNVYIAVITARVMADADYVLVGGDFPPDVVEPTASGYSYYRWCTVAGHGSYNEVGCRCVPALCPLYYSRTCRCR